jgi:hypothetical protein
MARSRVNDTGSSPIGQEWLRRELKLGVPAQAVESYVRSGARRTEVRNSRRVEFYPSHYAVPDDPGAHLKFALRHEPLDLGVLVSALKALEPVEIERWVRSEPTGAYSRRAWFLYEWSTGNRLDLEDVRQGNYVPMLDNRRHIVTSGRNSPRHRVRDNLLGGAALCPIVRRTDRLTRQMQMNVDAEARELIEGYDALTLTRAVNYLYTKETRSSFAIEGETPSEDRASRFVAALKAAPAFDPTSVRALLDLQGGIVDARYAARGWRENQNFVGETVANYRQQVHFISPRPSDVAELMDGWEELYRRTVLTGVDPVVAAAVISFAFVFIHPFEDGNGRIHRFLIHHVLAKTGFSPPQVIFPVSAAIVRDRRSYDEALEGVSRPLFGFIHWSWSHDQELVVKNETIDLYRYFDATGLAEYLYDRVTDTVRRDLREELGFVAVFDAAMDGVLQVVDMPDRKASLFVRLALQNGGRLSSRKRGQFDELSEDEIARMEEAVQYAMGTV